VQDTLTHAVEHFVAFWGDSYEELGFWLRRTLHFKLLGAHRDAIRQAQREKPLTAGDAQRPAPTPTPPQQLEQQEAHTEMERLVAKLPADDQQIIRLRVFDKWAFEDISDLLHCSENAAIKRLLRAFDRLRLVKLGLTSALCWAPAL
jgi:RNA polymerase sigma factor (sigma-70 family)